MKIELLTGIYDLELGYESLYQAIDKKINTYASYIDNTMQEEDIEWTERKITYLTKDWQCIQQQLNKKQVELN